jgi:serine/threonine-protein kinase HipA
LKYLPASRVELEKFFRLIVFNYLFSNGDAHLKNFSVLESPGGDYFLSPTYDLINTRIHVDDTDFALDGGLFEDNIQSSSTRKSGNSRLGDFYEFARRLNISDSRRNKLLNPFCEKQEFVETLIRRSYLNEQTKRAYLLHYQTRRNRLNS